MQKETGPKVDVIVPAYNEEKTLAGTLETILETNLFSNVICVNDGSTDGTQETLDAFKDRVTALSYKKNRGKGYALTKGIEATESEIIMFLDADLINITEKHFKNMIAALTQEDYSGVVGTVDDVFLKLWPKITRSISGQRAYFRKDLMPLLPEMKETRYGVEVFLNETYKNKRVKDITLKGANQLQKYRKDPLHEAALEALQEVYEVSREFGKNKATTTIEKVKKSLENI